MTQNPLFKITTPFNKTFDDFKITKGQREAIGSEDTTPGSAKSNSGGWEEAAGIGSLSAALNTLPIVGPILGTAAGFAAPLATPMVRKSRLEGLTNGELTINDGRYEELNPLDRLIGLNDQQVTNVAAGKRLRGIENTDAFSEAHQYLTEQGLSDEQATARLLPQGAATKVSSLKSTGNKIAETKQLVEALENDVEGSKLLIALREKNGGKELSRDDLRTIRNEAFRKSQGYRGEEQRQTLAKESHDQKIAESNATINYNKGVLAVNEGNLKLARDKERNRQTEFGAKLDYENNVARYNYNLANERDRRKYESEGKDRDLRRDLAVLGLDDKAAERRYQAERDERKDRQLMIMQLMKGLGNLGGAFAL